MVKGKHIAITGILVFFKRRDAFGEISLRGGVPEDAVSLVGDNHRHAHLCVILEKILVLSFHVKFFRLMLP